MNLTACWRLFRRTWHLAVPGVVFSLLSPVCLAGPGDLDITLAGTGKMRVAAGGGIDAGYAVVRQTDGKLIVAGESGNFGVTVPSLVRYNTNGTPDLTFGTGGKVMLESAFGGARAVAIAPTTGKILVAGYATLSGTDSSFLLARLNTDGTLDTTFNSNGFLFTAMSSGQDIAHALAVQTDGRIVLAGEAGGSIALARYDANGSLDTTLDSDGKLISAFAGTGRALLLMSGTNSKMVVAGQQISSGQKYAIVTRFNFNGSLDNSFSNGSGFSRRLDLQEANGLTLLAVLAGEEKLIVTGGRPSGLSSGPIPVPSFPDFGLWSLNAADGAVDTSFGTGGALIETVRQPGLAVRVQNSGSSPSRLVVLDMGSEIRRFTLTGAVDSAFGGGAGKVDSLIGGGQALLLQPDGRIVTAGTDRDDLVISRLTSAGAADTTFSADGFRQDDVGNLAASARAALVQPDGKLLVAGDRVVMRFLPDGALDPTFDEDGRLPLRFPVFCMALQANGKIVMMGNSETETPSGTTRQARLLRFHGDGRVDFDEITSEPIAGQAWAMRLQPDGKVLVAGVYNVGFPGSAVPFLAVYRYLSNGMLDDTFSGDGAAPVAASGIIGESGETVGAKALALQADGRIVVAGRLIGAADYDFGVARLLPDGTLDNTFSGDGTAAIPMGAGDDLPTALALQNGKIVVAGTVDGAADDVGMARLLADGTLDNTFGTLGKSIVSLGTGDDSAGALLVQVDGKLCLAGTASNGAATEFLLARFTADGALDNTFGTGGKVNIDLTPGGAERGLALAVDPVRRLVIAGGASNFFGIARVLGDPFGSITAISRNPGNGVVALEGYATPGYSNALKTSTSLSGFTATGTVNPDASGFWQTTQPSSDARRFYQLTLP